MEAQLEAIRDQQKESWNKFSAGWKKYNDFTMNFLKPMGDAIIEALHIKETDTVLDIASGTGEPAVTIAGIATKGRVVATDVSDKMLDIAQEYATEHGIKNISFKVTDVTDMSFDENSFDKISCRMGFMFFPGMQLAANEIYRVCKAGGKFATSVWSMPETNPWVTILMGVLNKNIEMPPPPTGAPGMFRCAKPGLIKGFLENAGFKNVLEKIISGKVDYDNINKYWEMMNEVAAPVVGALSKTDEVTKQKVKDGVYEALNSKLTNEKLVLDFASIIISGEK